MRRRHKGNCYGACGSLAAPVSDSEALLLLFHGWLESSPRSAGGCAVSLSVPLAEIKFSKQFQASID